MKHYDLGPCIEPYATWMRYSKKLEFRNWRFPLKTINKIKLEIGLAKRRKKSYIYIALTAKID